MRAASLALSLAAAAALPSSVLAVGPTTTFPFTGSDDQYTVPAGVGSVHIEASGGQGASVPFGGQGSVSPGGRGALVTGDFAVVPGQILYLLVGGKGLDGGTPADAQSRRALGGGGQGAGGGGGATEVRNCPFGGVGCTGNPSLIIAGGGGGAAYGYAATSSEIPIPGGDAGAPATGFGMKGSDISTIATGGAGGNKTAGGAGGVGTNDGVAPASGEPGTAGNGGAGAMQPGSGFGMPGGAIRVGGGGGGGYFGGGGGGTGHVMSFGPGYFLGGGGGGGSSYVAPGATDVTYAPDTAAAGAQKITITPADPTPVPVCTDVAGSTPTGGGTIVLPLNCTGTKFTYAVGAEPAGGVLGAINQTTGLVSYTPNAGFSGTDTFTYKATNIGGPSAIKKVTITVPASPVTPGDNTNTGGTNTGGTNTGGTNTGGTTTGSSGSNGSNGSNGVDATPEVKKCVVPVLKGTTLKAATELLKTANCTLGKVKKPAKKKGKPYPKKLVVVHAAIRAGSILKLGATVDITLDAAPKKPANKK